MCDRLLANMPYSGTEVIKDYGKEHEETGKLIVYTSADSVFQIAANEEIVPIEDLYKYCKIARGILSDPHGVGRVIARPYVSDGKEFKRTANRRDFSLAPPKDTLLNKIKDAGLDVIAVGKIEDIFAGSGITEAIHTSSNSEGMDVAESIAKRDFNGLCFINLVDFDSSFGHRQDVSGYANALSEFDLRLGNFIKLLNPDDALIITADHGCDPGDNDTDHSREYVPLLIYNKEKNAENLGTIDGFTFVSKVVSDMLKVNFTPDFYHEK